MGCASKRDVDSALWSCVMSAMKSLRMQLHSLADQGLFDALAGAGDVGMEVRVLLDRDVEQSPTANMQLDTTSLLWICCAEVNMSSPDVSPPPFSYPVADV